MDRAIDDAAAVAFATGFYDALGGGEPVPCCLRPGPLAIEMTGLPSAGTPVLKINARLQSPYCPWALQDIYVSFATTDGAAGEAHLVWVSDLTGRLRNALCKALKAEDCSIWVDYGAQKDAPIGEGMVDRAIECGRPVPGGHISGL